MSEVWDGVYQSDNTFFGEEPSSFATLCLNHMKSNNVKKVLEIGAGHGRDTLFFASNGLEVEALDYSSIGIEIINKKAHENKLPVNSQLYDVKKPLPFKDACFDAAYSHMLLNMRFSQAELHSVFSEIRRVLRPNGLNYFSVRNHNDQFYGAGVKVEDGVYDINGFEVRFFSEKEILDLIAKEGFNMLWIREEYEEPVTLYLVAAIKLKKN
ncbi:MAG: class I SAM-dependent methyltransferase [Nitrosopumilus sp.]|nr:class I SAM-dependent methyltransferase [Nitrosopumilus sp.]